MAIILSSGVCIDGGPVNQQQCLLKESVQFHISQKGPTTLMSRQEEHAEATATTLLEI
ncbi:MAG: hypothetical protein GQ578_10120, partial [Desulfuromonadaceae bacterium]|nr:hypothetical protein [Desulfuromonadaceae bacterium]